MPFTVMQMIQGMLLPCIITGILYFSFKKIFPESLNDRHSGPLSIALGFVAGIFLINQLEFPPTRTWHWYPYLIAFSCLIYPMIQTSGVTWIEKLIFQVVALCIAGWLLSPDRENIDPSRMTLFLAFSITAIIQSVILDRIVQTQTGTLLPCTLWATMAGTSVILLFENALRFTQISLVGTAALFGLAIASFFVKQDQKFTGLALPFSLMNIGALILAIPDRFGTVPNVAILLIPLVPMLLIAGTFGPISKMTGFKRTILLLSCPAIVLSIAVFMAVWAELQNEY